MRIWYTSRIDTRVTRKIAKFLFGLFNQSKINYRIITVRRGRQKEKYRNTAQIIYIFSTATNNYYLEVNRYNARIYVQRAIHCES